MSVAIMTHADAGRLVVINLDHPWMGTGVGRLVTIDLNHLQMVAGVCRLVVCIWDAAGQHVQVLAGGTPERAWESSPCGDFCPVASPGGLVLGPRAHLRC